jgi:site-specific recombinase XerD
VLTITFQREHEFDPCSQLRTSPRFTLRIRVPILDRVKSHIQGAAVQLQTVRTQYLRSLHTTRTLSRHTIRAYAGDTKALVEYIGPDTHPVNISNSDILSFFELQRSAGLSEASLRRRLAGVRSFCRWIHAQDLSCGDPVVGLGFRFRRPRRLPRAVPREDLRKLVDSLSRSATYTGEDSSDSGISRINESTTLLGVLLILGTGLRVAELVGLRCDDIDLSEQSLRVMGKGSRERTVFIADQWTIDLLASYVDVRATRRVRHPHLLINRNDEPLSTEAFRRRLATQSIAAGLRQRVTPHMLRHSAATELIDSGANIRFVQRLLGHASLLTTEIYTHVSDQSLRQTLIRANVLEQFRSDN